MSKAADAGWAKRFEPDGSDYPWSADDAAVTWLAERGGVGRACGGAT